MTLSFTRTCCLIMAVLALGAATMPSAAHAEQQLRQKRQEIQRDAVEDRRANLKRQLEALPPEQRKAKIEQMKQDFAQKKEEKKAAFDNRWNQATPEQKAKFCASAQQKCNAGGQGGDFACKVAQNRCAGQ